MTTEFPADNTLLTLEEWRRLWTLSRRLLIPATPGAMAAELVASLIEDFSFDAVQVWMRLGELSGAGPAYSRQTDRIEPVAFQSKSARPRPPRRMHIADSLAGFTMIEGVPYSWNARGSLAIEWKDCQWALQAGMKAGHSVPLTLHGRSLGAIVAWISGEFTVNTEELLDRVGDLASLSLAQIRRLQASERQVQWLTSLQQVTGLLTNPLSLQDLYRTIFEQIARVLPVDRFSINLCDDSASRIERVLHVESQDGRYVFPAPDRAQPVAGTIWERVLRTGEPILLNRLPEIARTAIVRSNPAATVAIEAPSEAAAAAAAAEAAQRTRPLAASAMYAPMMFGEHIVGVMAVQSYAPSAYDQETLDLLASIASQAALAIENTRLLDRLNLQIVETRKANRLKSQFIANISHEVRTPLNAIIGFARIVRRRGAEALAPQQLQNLEYVLESADHLLQIINEVLDLSRLEAGRITLQSEQVDLRNLVARVTAELEPLASDTDNHVDLEIVEPLSEVETDPTRVRQILFNLVSNALKFTRGGKIIVRAGRPTAESLQPESLRNEGWIVVRPIPLSSDPSPALAPSPPPAPVSFRAVAPANLPATPPSGDGKCAVVPRLFFLDVIDTGLGMRPENVVDLFEEFRQESTGDTRAQSGAGLGLSIVRRLVDLMQGGIAVQTTPGEGSTFRVVLREMTSAAAGTGADASGALKSS